MKTLKRIVINIIILVIAFAAIVAALYSCDRDIENRKESINEWIQENNMEIDE